jgi:hypothetical protein
MKRFLIRVAVTVALNVFAPVIHAQVAAAQVATCVAWAAPDDRDWYSCSQRRRAFLYAGDEAF